MFFIKDFITNGYNINIIDVMSILSLISASLVILTKNPIVSVLFLIILFFNIACFLLLVGLQFIGFSYLLVYVGAVSILFLFILMLINIRISELLSKASNALPLILMVFILLVNVLFNSTNINLNKYIKSISDTEAYYENNFENVNNLNNITNIFYNKKSEYGSLFTWQDNMMESNPIVSLGNVMYTSYPMLLIVTSFILLLAMVGVIVITLNSNDNLKK